MLRLNTWVKHKDVALSPNGQGSAIETQVSKKPISKKKLIGFALLLFFDFESF